MCPRLTPPMPNRRRTLSLIVLVASWGAGAAAQAGVPWHTNLAGAKAAALVSQRPVLVVFTAAWSEASVNLEASALGSDEAVALLTACFEPVQIDVDADPALARTMGVAHLPGACVIDQDDRVVSRFDIPATPAAFVAAAGRAAQQAAASSRAIVAANPAPPATAASPAPPGPETPVEQPAPLASVPPATRDVALAEPAPGWPAQRVTRPLTLEPQPSGPSTTAAVVPPASAGAAPAAALATAPSSGPWLGQPAAPPPATQPPSKSQSRMPAWDAMSKSIVGLFKRPAGTATAPGGKRADDAAPAPATAMPEPIAVAGTDAERMPVGLDGFCPVTLIDKGVWAEGRAQWGVRHRGRTYLFTGPSEQQAFLAAPDRYAPGLSGDDPVLALDSGRQVPGQRRYGVTYQSRMYLFSSPDTRATFAADPQRYTTRVTIAEQTTGERSVTR